MPRTITLLLPYGPIVADIYEPAAPTAHVPVLLVHGWGGSGRYWRSTAERLARRTQVIVPDLPGIGRSMPVRTPPDIFALADGLRALLDHLGVEQAMLVGHSMGAGVGLVLAAQHPALVLRLVLTSISLFRNDGERAFFRTLTDAMGVMMLLRGTWMADVPGLPEQFATRFFYRVPRDRELLREGLLDYLTMDRATALACARSAADPRINALAAQVQCPTLLVVTREDNLMPAANAPDTAATIPNCDMHWIERCGHVPMLEKPDEYMALVEPFLFAHEDMPGVRVQSLGVRDRVAPG